MIVRLALWRLADTPVETVDPWCSEVFVKQETPSPLYVAVRYKECLTRPVRVQPLGCRRREVVHPVM